jgi:hypothetical protein
LGETNTFNATSSAKTAAIIMIQHGQWAETAEDSAVVLLDVRIHGN